MLPSLKIGCKKISELPKLDMATGRVQFGSHMNFWSSSLHVSISRLDLDMVLLTY